jgi:DNA-binding HxlR family transcriptional regulator
MSLRFANLSVDEHRSLQPAALLPNCSIARAAELFADAWTVLLLRELFWGASRYDELQRHTGMASNVLASRLKKLNDAGITSKTPAEDDGRRFDYALTPRGRSLFPVLMSVLAWGDEHSPGPHGPLIKLRHITCGQPTGAGVHCSACGQALSPDNLHTEINLRYLQFQE